MQIIIPILNVYVSKWWWRRNRCFIIFIALGPFTRFFVIWSKFYWNAVKPIGLLNTYMQCKGQIVFIYFNVDFIKSYAVVIRIVTILHVFDILFIYKDFTNSCFDLPNACVLIKVIARSSTGIAIVQKRRLLCGWWIFVDKFEVIQVWRFVCIIDAKDESQEYLTTAHVERLTLSSCVDYEIFIEDEWKWWNRVSI